MPQPLPLWKRYFHSAIAREISSVTRYYDETVQLDPLPHDPLHVVESLECGRKTVSAAAELPDFSVRSGDRSAVLLNGNLNYHFDIQGLLAGLKPRLSRTSRVVAVLFNPYFGWLYRLMRKLGLKSGEEPTTFITHAALYHLARLAGFELVRSRPAIYVPWSLLGLGTLINRLLPAIPLIRHFGLVSVAVLRPVIASPAPSLSIVVPARNERGNIRNALDRLPTFPGDVEVVFVEGHSSDGTWEEIQRAEAEYRGPASVRSFQQTGRGKADAVRAAFAVSTGDLLTILDADLTMPPEKLTDFYEAYRSGLGDFVNGSRLVYPMEGEAMRFLNRLGNAFFAKALSSVLGVRITDSLCGTKLVARHDYERFVRWRADFGDFDPFGDFELLFPAAILALGIVDVPVRYRARTYGSTNIRRFRDGLTLLKMTLVGLVKVKTGRG